jgi:adenosylcobyric acid synthase
MEGMSGPILNLSRRIKMRENRSKIKNQFIIGTGTSVGKNTIVLSMLRNAVQAGLKVTPFKPFAIDINLDYEELKKGPRTPSIDFQCRAADIEFNPVMNPVLISYSRNSRIPMVYIRGHVYHTGLKENELPEIFNTIFKEAVAELTKKADFIIAEGSGGVVDALGRDYVHSQAAEALDAQIHLVTNCVLGGGFAAVVGSLELMPDKLRKRISSVILNRFNGRMYEREVREFRQYLTMRYGINQIHLIPDFPTLKYLDESAFPRMSEEKQIEREISFLSGRICNILEFNRLMEPVCS